nr:hypothetical protein [Bacteroidota bacterium]
MKIVFKISIVLLTLTYTINNAMGQENSSYEMTLVKVIDQEVENKVTIILKVSPTIENFKLILSGRAEYAFGRKSIQTNIQKDPNTQIVVYGDDFLTKAPELHDLIKEDIEIGENEFLLVFNFSNIKGKDLAEGYFKYGLWESNNSEIRDEQTFFFGENEIIKN